MHRAKLEVMFPNRTIMQDDTQAFVNFEHPTTRYEVTLEMIEGLTAQPQPETAWLRRRLQGPMP